jgi:uncharacterized protein
MLTRRPFSSFSSSKLTDLSRRDLLRMGFKSMAAISAGTLLSACNSTSKTSNINNIGLLSETPDENGLLLPEGFSSRIIAKTDKPVVEDGNYAWHERPDGGAIYTTSSGGWIYVSNSELSNGRGGVGAIEFNSNGEIIDAYQLLSGTTMNCAGGPTPWNTWLSCEEYDEGMVWECFPLERGKRSAVRRDALGVFQHEAAAVDPLTGIVYLTEDQTDGCLYRFVPNVIGNLTEGRLQAAIIDNVDVNQIAGEGNVTWVDIPDRTAANESTRSQAHALGAAKFIRGEGAWFHNDVLYISTTGNAGDGGLVWALEPNIFNNSGTITQIYNRVDLFTEDQSLNGIDNITVSASGDVIVAEDTDDMQMQAITPDGQLIKLLQVTGHTILGFNGELTGPAFDPSGNRLYFSSQRGTSSDFAESGKFIGITYEVTGPFR